MMILKEHNISVRLPQERAVDTGITFVQNDKDVYKLNVRIFDGVNEIDYSEVDSATITFLKRDNNVVQGDMQIEADQLTYVLGTNEIAAPGKLIATIQLLGANERLTTARFVFNVEKDLITEDAVKSTSEFAILQQLKNELEEIDVVELRNEFEAHKAESVQDAGGVHGLEIEEGTWTPSSDGATFDVVSATYTKIGNLIKLQCEVNVIVQGTDFVIRGIPFLGVSKRSYGYYINYAEPLATQQTYYARIDSTAGGRLGIFYTATSGAISSLRPSVGTFWIDIIYNID